MFKKMKIKARIKKLIKQIAFYEQKRTRSQAALIEAILTHQSPTDGDVDYFNMYTNKIEEVRQEITNLKKEIGIE